MELAYIVLEKLEKNMIATSANDKIFFIFFIYTPFLCYSSLNSYMNYNLPGFIILLTKPNEDEIIFL